MIALISDIHSNLEALRAVMDDLKKRKIDTIFCLGDIIGYGPNPRECIDIVSQHCEFSLCGNHEEAVLFSAEDFHPGARRAIDWTRSELNSENYCIESNYKIWDFLGELRKRICDENRLYVHASPRQPTREYIFPIDVEQRQEKMNSIFNELIPYDICFVGHTHIPGLFTDDLQFRSSAELDNSFSLCYPGQKLVNVGSVGQPRDRDQRACYCLLNEKTVSWIRLEYDYKTTIKKILDNDYLMDRYGTRLVNGV